MPATTTTDLWALIESRTEIDPNDLASAIDVQAAQPSEDYRTRLLIHESLAALEAYWGQRFEAWLKGNPQRSQLQGIRQARFDEIGFPSLERRIMEKTSPERVRQFLEYLGQRVRGDHRLYIAGSVALILPGYLSRKTEDIDVVDEIPKEIRDNHKLLDDLQQIFTLHLGHVQTHYFPTGWMDRAHHFDDFGRLSAYLLDVYDVFLSKLFSARVKDIQDLTALAPRLDKATLEEKLLAHCGSFLAAPRLKELATNNWKVLYGEDLPT
jgi:hypothetical protein